ncbi:PD-(D/E)XK motif protein [Rapidithrix thailandica]|uniref:PD-(D/E)XK motif protein n=1 Tax=Rapidithrix thailandica TaxID=413964 RepID=A0AAW9SL53_9BACT
MMKIEKIWDELEGDKFLQSGLLYKRFSGKVKPDVYVSLKVPERLRCIAVHLDKSFDLQLQNCDKFRDIKIEILPDEKQPQKQFMLILLLNNQHKDIFSALCEDLISEVSETTKESSLINQLLLRLEKWRLLFEKLGQQGLSDEAQRGLYGELYFLRKFLTHSDNHEFCISSWKGPEKAIQDFQFSDWAVEVKTTHGKNHQKLQITSERQLDTSFVPSIFLYHLSLDVRRHHGETLNEIVEGVEGLISNNPVVLNAFKVKLLEANYFDIHLDLYNENGYSIRQENIYRITEDFPRITESLVPSGVGDVKYTVIISNNSWSLSEDQLFSEIANY